MRPSVAGTVCTLAPAPATHRSARVIARMIVLLLCSGIGIATGLAPAGAGGAERPPAGVPAPRTAPAGWWNDRVFYEIYVRAFQDSDGDGIGDLRGVEQRLDDLVALGIGGIWLMPIFESDTEHGYATVDYRSVERDYGSLADLRSLLAAARARDLKVLIDFVPNHTSSANPWFRSALADPRSRFRRWYRFAAKDPRQPGPYGPAWHPAAGRGFYFGLFGSRQPDLDLTNPAVTRELIATATYWLDQGVDGFRIDAAKHLIERGNQYEGTDATLDWLRRFQRALVRHRPDVLTVAEVWSPTSAVARYVPAASDLAFDFDAASAMVRAVRDGNDVDLLVELSLASKLFPAGQFATFLSNHDQTRVATAIGAGVRTNGAPDRLRLAAAVLLTAPGVPFLYYGEETGTVGDKPDEQLRLPMAWDESPAGGFSTGPPFRPLPAEAGERNVARTRTDAASTWTAYRDLIALRRSLPALRGPGFENLRTPATGLAAWLRSGSGQTVAVVHNLTDRPVRPVVGAVRGVPAGSAVVRFTNDPALSSATAVAAPEPDGAGSVTGWSPVAELGPRRSLVIELGR
jgi:glycosidase